jgi:hypothetical protein
MRDGGSWARGIGVGVGAGVRVGRGVFSGGGAEGVSVGVSADAGKVESDTPGNMGSKSGVGSLPGASGLGSGSGIGVLVAAAWVGSGEAGCAVSVMVTVSVGRMGAVIANTTAPSSLMTGGGGALRRVHAPQPKPARMRINPKMSIPRERIRVRLFISSNRIPTERIVMPRDRAGGIFCTSINPIQNAFPCQVKRALV